MNNLFETVQEAKTFLLEKGIKKPTAGIILGTGMGDFLNYIEIKLSISYTDIPHFSVSTVEYHKGNMVYGMIGRHEVIVMHGRFHYYEGFSMQQISFPVRVMKELGIEYLLLSNVAGGINPDYKKGDMIIIEDHINLLPDNPLRGISDPRLGNRFADMICPYDKKLRELLKVKFKIKNIPVKEGVYVAVMGPSLETRAEYRWLRSTGADMVGMSTVPEVIVAAQIGLPCAAVSVITDECDPDDLEAVNIGEILSIAKKADEELSAVFADLISESNDI